MKRDIVAAINWTWRNAHLLLCCSLDGVLAEQGPQPGDIFVPSSRRALISSLASMDSISVCVTGGRRLVQIQSAIGRDRRIHYVGLRGLEIEGPRLAFFHLGAARSADVLTPLAALLHGVARETPGLVVEYRNLHVAVRMGWVADPAVRESVMRRVRDIATPFVHTHRLRVLQCGTDIEILPDVRWTTGDAIREIKGALERRYGHTAVVVIGNGLGEDDAFSAVDQVGLAVHVGESGLPSAFRVGGPDEVDPILLGLVRLGHSRLGSDARIAL